MLQKQYKAISPYLIGLNGAVNSHLVIYETQNPINELPRLVMGTKPIDGGNYIFNKKGMDGFLSKEPEAEQLFRPYIGAKELLSSLDRWILYLQKASPALLARLPLVKERMSLVKEFRLASKAPSTRELAKTPELYHLNVIPADSFIAIPGNSSSDREYVPIAYLSPPTIPSNSMYVLENASLSTFGILISAMHMCWLHNIGGRLGDACRYSKGIVYNTFPMPKASKSQLEKIEILALGVLEARKEHDATLLEMYSPITMPTALRKAHEKLDRAVDRLYRKSGFSSEQERFEFLMKMYEEMIAPLSKPGKGRRRKKSKPSPSKGK